MSKLTLAVMAAVIGLAGCASQKTANDPDTAPSDLESDFEGDDYADYEEPLSSTPDAPEADMAASEEYDVEQSEEPAPAEPEQPPKACAELQQSLCEVTVGCAWSTEKVCVDQ